MSKERVCNPAESIYCGVCYECRKQFGSTPKTECYPDPRCRCCECNGVKCLVWHPGHDHRTEGHDLMPWKKH